MKRVFGVVIETLEGCGGRVEIIRRIEDLVVTEKILSALNMLDVKQVRCAWTLSPTIAAWN